MLLCDVTRNVALLTTDSRLNKKASQLLLSTYDLSTLYTTLRLIKEKLLNYLSKLLIERGHFIWLVMRNAFFLLLNKRKNIIHMSINL